MAIYSTLFVSEPSRLTEGFPGWKPPLPEPVTRTIINLFTRQPVTVTTREPDWEGYDPTEFEMPEYRVVSIQGDYQAYLENRIPPFVQSQPHWCGKNLTMVELEPLIATALNREQAKLESVLYAHPSLGAGLEQFPDEFVTIVKAADEQELRSIAEKWAQQMSHPDYTHSVSGERLEDDWTVDDALSVLEPIVKLAKQSNPEQSLYLLLEG